MKFNKESILQLIRKPKFIFASIFLIIVFLYYGYSSSPSVTLFKTAEISRGNLIISVSATGTLEPEEVIDVGAQVAGQIIKFGTGLDGKTVDYGSIVEAGAVLAQIDDSVYQAEVSSADAQLKRASADLLQAQAKQKLSEQEWKRAQLLGPSDALSKSSYQTYQANFEVATASVTVGEAAIIQAQASLTKAERNLGFTTIKSPVKGVIIDRRVNIGQTVVSNLNAPSLFLLAKDLKKMQLWIAVNEADIGKITPGQLVNFTVDTFPEEQFEGIVRKIRLNASMTQNVVTYVVEVDTDNSSGQLLPYLTANAQFQISNHQNVLLIPNSALRWTPREELIASKYLEEYLAFKKDSQRKIIWTTEGSFVRPIKVKFVGTDNIMSEIEGADLTEGTKIVTGEEIQDDSMQAASKNPFAPQMPSRKR